MAIRDILVSLDSSVPGEARLPLALALAGSHKGRLTAVYVLPAPRSTAPPIGLGPVPPSTPAWMLDPAGEPPRDPERAEVMEGEFRSELRYRGIEGEWHLLEEGNLADLVEYANTVDLTILGQQSGKARGDSAGEFAPDAIVVEVGRRRER